MIKYEVVEIEEPDFGCEGRPDEAVPMAKVTLRSVKDGVMTMAEIADGYLYQEASYIRMMREYGGNRE